MVKVIPVRGYFLLAVRSLLEQYSDLNSLLKQHGTILSGQACVVMCMSALLGIETNAGANVLLNLNVVKHDH